MSKPLLYLVIHCSATPEGLNVTAQSIERYHREIKGWSRTGYSKLFLLDGTVHDFRSENGDQLVDQDEYTFGTISSNFSSFHWCYVGGCDKTGKKHKDTLTESQFISLEREIKKFLQLHQHVQIGGHNQFDEKPCPSFNTIDKLRQMFVPEINILKIPLKIKL